LCRSGMPWTPWDEKCCERNDVKDAATLLRRSEYEIHARRRRVRKCFHCPHWDYGTCGIEEAGSHMAGESTRNLQKYRITHICHLGYEQEDK